MAITVEQRTAIIELVVGMFGAAPGASVLSELVASYEAGSTLKQIAANLAKSDQFKSIFPTFMTNGEFATKVVDQLVGSSVVAAEKTAAVALLTAQLNSGKSRSDVFVDAISELNAVASTNAAWGNAAVAFDNKVAAAVYFSVDKQLNGSSLAALQAVVSSVTNSTASLDAAKAAADAAAAPAPAPSQTFTLTASSAAANEGQTVFFTLDTSNVATGTQYVYTITGDGITSADVLGGSLTGTITVGSTGKVIIPLTLREDALTEGAETLTLSVAGQSASVTINDTSLTPPPASQTIVLNNEPEAKTGGAGDDIFRGTDKTLVLDKLDGGLGNDTLIYNDTTGNKDLKALALEMVNVETVEVRSVAGITSDLSGFKDVANVNATFGTTATLTGAATTNISVASTVTGAVIVDGGKNITVAASEKLAADAVTIGGTTAPKGDVVVSSVGKAYDAAAGFTLNAVTVTGGKTVSVTQSATSNSAAAAKDITATTIIQGAVTINANTDTESISVKQDPTVTAKNAKLTTGGVTETATVKFGALKNGDVLASNGLTFTAKADMTAAEVAATFANLASGLAVAGKDTQSSGLASQGTYTGAFTTAATSVAGFTSAVATGDTVIFTAAQAFTDATDLTFTLTNTSGNSVAPVVTTVQGAAHNATPAGGVMGVTAGQVTIAGGANATAVKTITIDGYGAASAITGATSALEVLSLSKGLDFTVADAAQALTLNLASVGAAAKTATLTTAAVAEQRALLDLNNAATTTLNIKSDGANTVSLDLAGATATKTLNVSGTGLLDAKTATVLNAVTTITVTESAGLNLGTTATTNVTSVDTTGTTGAVTIGLDGGKAKYTGGAGKDAVTITGVTGTFSKAINLGAGDDTLTLSALTAAELAAIPATNVLEGGDGTDTLVITAANAVEMSKDAVFAGKINGFEKLSLGNATAAGTVNLANLDAISYVISANSASVAAPAVKEVFTVDFATSGTITGADTILFNATTLTLAGGETPQEIATKFYSQTFTDWDVTSVAGTVVTLTAKTAGVTADVVAGNFTITNVGGGAELPAVVVTTTTQGTAAGAAAAALTLDKLASGGTLELTATGAGAIVKVTGAATGTADVLNVVTKADGDVGKVTAADVETFNLKINDSIGGGTAPTFTTVYTDANGTAVKTADVSSTTLAIAGSASTKTINVEGAGKLTLDVSANTKLTTVDANTATGALTLDLSSHNGVAITVNGGSGNDVLKATTGANAKADVLNGGAGKDTLSAGSNGAKLTGGAGDDLFILDAGNKETNAFSSILDFQVGDTLQLKSAGVAVSAFAKLTTVLNENTATFSNFVDAAIAQAVTGASVWFSYKGDSYIVVDNTAESLTFENGVDSVIALVGVDLTNASYNSTSGIVALV